VRPLQVPKWTTDAVRRILASHSPLLFGTPQIAVNPEDLSAESVKLALPIYSVRVPAGRSKIKSASARSGSWFKPRRIGWRVFLEAKKAVSVAVELRADRNKESYDQLQHGSFIQHTFNAIRKALRNKRAKNQQASSGLVQMPALYFSALWLKGNRGKDYFVSLVSVPGSLRSGQFYTRAQIVRALNKRHAERRQSHQALLARRAKSKFAARDGADASSGPQ
jgi:hypothetical protein